jgi:hypothetical protein
VGSEEKRLISGNSMGKNRNIKDMSINEASDFWDEHDFVECDDVRGISEIRFSLTMNGYLRRRVLKK